MTTSSGHQGASRSLNTVPGFGWLSVDCFASTGLGCARVSLKTLTGLGSLPSRSLASTSWAIGEISTGFGHHGFAMSRNAAVGFGSPVADSFASIGLACARVSFSARCSASWSGSAERTCTSCDLKLPRKAGIGVGSREACEGVAMRKACSMALTRRSKPSSSHRSTQWIARRRSPRWGSVNLGLRSRPAGRGSKRWTQAGALQTRRQPAEIRFAHSRPSRRIGWISRREICRPRGSPWEFQCPKSPGYQIDLIEPWVKPPRH